jgi:hypothetical protein
MARAVSLALTLSSYLSKISGIGSLEDNSLVYSFTALLASGKTHVPSSLDLEVEK